MLIPDIDEKFRPLLVKTILDVSHRNVLSKCWRGYTGGDDAYNPTRVNVHTFTFSKDSQTNLFTSIGRENFSALCALT